jgi:hypothetical protein
MASAELSGRVEKVVGYPPLSEMSDSSAASSTRSSSTPTPFNDLPGKWRGAILKSEENRPNLRIVDRD